MDFRKKTWFSSIILIEGAGLYAGFPDWPKSASWATFGSHWHPKIWLLRLACNFFGDFSNHLAVGTIGLHVRNRNWATFRQCLAP